MRIGVDATCWANGRGYGRFARELLREMVALAPDHEFLCFGDPHSLAAFDLEAPNLRRIEVTLTAPPAVAASADGHRSPADMLRLTYAVWRVRPDVFFCPSVYTYFPLPPGLRAVVTVHDAIAERFPELTLPSGRARLFWRLKVRLALSQARIVLTVSDFAAREIGEVLGVAPSRLRVAVEAPAAAYRPSARADIVDAAARVGLGGDDSWFAYVGGFNPHKRVDLIIRAHADIAAGASAPPHLLLVGRTSGDVFLGEVDKLRAAIAAAGTSELVHWLGFVPDEELRHLLSGALALVLPSENEGFGLPAVEAAACGTAVIATTASPLPELLVGGGIFVAPGDAAALTSAMRLVLDDGDARRGMGCRARERAAQLSWTSSARSALSAIREAAA